MKRHIFYLTVAAAVALSAGISSFTSDARGHGRDTQATGVVREISPDDSFPAAVDRPVVIDFYATWCGPCKAYRPVFDKVAKDYRSKADFVRVDVDKCPGLAQQFRISAVPTTVILTPDGYAYTSTGAVGEAQLRLDIEKALK